MSDGQARRDRKPLHWVGSSKKDLREFPPEVQRDMGYILGLVQLGSTPDAAKPLKGYKGADVLEIVDRHDSDTYRVVYTIRFREAVYVVHAWQKKSKRGIKTDQRDLDLVKSRLLCAMEDYKERYQDER